MSNEGFVSCEGSGFVRLAMLLPGLVIKFFSSFSQRRLCCFLSSWVLFSVSRREGGGLRGHHPQFLQIETKVFVSYNSSRQVRTLSNLFASPMWGNPMEARQLCCIHCLHAIGLTKRAKRGRSNKGVVEEGEEITPLLDRAGPFLLSFSLRPRGAPPPPPSSSSYSFPFPPTSWASHAL